jgi:hypothetical protein
MPYSSQRYLKHEIAATPDTGNEPGRFTSMSWHPERALHLILTTSSQLVLSKQKGVATTNTMNF